MHKSGRAIFRALTSAQVIINLKTISNMVKRLQRLFVVLFAALLPAVGAYAQDTTPKLNYNSEGGYYEIANEEDMIAFITFCRVARARLMRV